MLRFCNNFRAMFLEMILTSIGGVLYQGVWGDLDDLKASCEMRL